MPARRRSVEPCWSGACSRRAGPAAAAEAFGLSERTVRKWLARFRSEGAAGLQNRSSAPHLVANRLPEPWVAMIAPPAPRVPHDRPGDRRASASAAQHRGRPSGPARPRPAGGARAERAGAALQPRTRRRARPPRHQEARPLRRIGHRITGDRRQAQNSKVGWEFVHVAVDDASGSPMSRSCRTRSASRPPASWSGRCAGSRARASGSSG